MAQGARRAHGVDDGGEGRVLMIESVEDRRLGVLEQRREAGGGIDAMAQRQRIDEKADQGLELDARAPGGDRAEHEVVVAADQRQQRGEGGFERHEQRRALCARELPQRMRRLLRDRERNRAAAIIHGGGARPIEGQSDRRRRVLQRVFPKGGRGGEPFARQRGALPMRVIAILNGQLRQIGGNARARGAVELGDLAQKQADGPAVENGVMAADDEDMLGCAAFEQMRPKQRTGFEIERSGQQHLDAGGEGGVIKRLRVLDHEPPGRGLDGAPARPARR